MTSFVNNYASTSSTPTPSNTVNFIQNDPQDSVYRCLNPSGLPAGSYMIWQHNMNKSDPLGVVEFALDLVLGTYYSRHALSIGPPAIWQAWIPIGGGAIPVISWTGAQGATQFGPALVAAAGDYNAAMVTATPNGNLSLNGPIANVQQALDYLQIYSPPPAGECTITVSPTPIPIGVWTPVPLTYQPLLSRGTFPPTGTEASSFVAAPGGVQIVEASASGTNLVNLSAVVGTSPMLAGTCGIRLLFNGVRTGGAIFNSDGSGGPQEFNTSLMSRMLLNTIVTIEVFNNTAAVFNIVQCNLFVLSLGPSP